MAQNHDRPLHLYVHIPFCPRLCPYCCFYVVPPDKGLARQFLVNVLRELNGIDGHSAWSTIYFGGGTPTALSTEMLEQLVSAVVRKNDDTLREVTVECNPCTLSAQKSAMLVANGVTRLSIGAQSFDPSVIASLGRKHSVAAIHQCITTARQAGCAHFNLDLMYGVPGQTLESWRSTLQIAVALKTEHISCYALTYEEDTDFFECRQRGDLIPNAELEAEMYHVAREILNRAGYLHYEVSNYALPGCECRHNLAYWRGANYAGIGPGAVSTRWEVRCRNSRMDANGSWTVEETEHLGIQIRAAERMALGLRTNDGVEESLFVKEFGFSPFDRWGKELSLLTSNGLMSVKRGRTSSGQKRLRLSEKGLAVADEIATYFV